MPVMDGYTAARLLRNRGDRVPIIALTAHAMRGDEEKCQAAGCSGFLSKPIDPDRLVDAVGEYLSTGGAAGYGVAVGRRDRVSRSIECQHFLVIPPIEGYNTDVRPILIDEHLCGRTGGRGWTRRISPSGGRPPPKTSTATSGGATGSGSSPVWAAG